ncbi:hypothetical protein PPYR_06830 [Photinus pyralis]|uniref:BHLH domain-containing protein n=1 Tax=Photinus pyralis TaxID=7054 RepID=A0A1Y1LQM0_PHOPY|nr:helix-loop-helix protein delilah-like [Photinus pyralis]KAB0798950.1 hypothetical protein PPYR_06830 [Photinus pyralis]
MDTLFPFNHELSQRLCLPVESPTYTDSNNNSDSDKTSSDDKYSLRPRLLRRRNAEQGVEKVPKTRTPKPKQKPAPLSKYRRKTANARERSRMREINQAFETLRRAVPSIYSTDVSTNEKLTKITTLRLAMKYISTLSAALNGPDLINSDFFSDCSDLDCLLLESDGESLPLRSDFSDNSLTPADFAVDFPEESLTSVDFSPDFTDHLSSFDPFFSNIS